MADEIGKVKAVQGHCHDYLAMILDFSIPGVLQVDSHDSIHQVYD
jgi:hypothetical protein